MIKQVKRSHFADLLHLDGAETVGGHDDVAVLLPADGRHKLVHVLLFPADK